MRIAVVDDCEEMATLLEAALDLNGFTAEVYTDPQTALNALRLGEPVEIVITDYTMQNMSGEAFALACRLEPNMASTLFLLITATPTASLKLKEGLFESTLKKPFSMSSLINEVRRILSHSKIG